MKLSISILAILFAQCCPAQHGPILKWDNAAFFKDKPNPKLLNWETYPETIDGKTLLTWGLFAASGAMWGAREAYHADPAVFERGYGVGSESFWGSDAWKRNYVGNNPDNAHKHEILGNFGRDIWHTFGFGSKALMFSGTFAIGCRKQPMKYRILNALIGFGIQSAIASATYNTTRNR